jgi:hypothetical protein
MEAAELRNGSERSARRTLSTANAQHGVSGGLAGTRWYVDRGRTGNRCILDSPEQVRFLLLYAAVVDRPHQQMDVRCAWKEEEVVDVGFAVADVNRR